MARQKTLLQRVDAPPLPPPPPPAATQLVFDVQQIGQLTATLENLKILQLHGAARKLRELKLQVWTFSPFFFLLVSLFLLVHVLVCFLGGAGKRAGHALVVEYDTYVLFCFAKKEVRCRCACL